MSAAPREPFHSGAVLQALYPLGGKVPGLERVPTAVRRATRRIVTSAAVHAHLARCRRTTLVAVTGSRGKTSLKDLLACMLAAAGPTLRTRHNDNDLYGLPATLLGVRPRDDFAVVEAGVMRPGDMRWMASLMRPDLAVLTGLGEDHATAFGGRDAVAAEKRLLLERARTVVIPADDPAATDLVRGLSATVITAGRSAAADVCLVDARLTWPDGLEAIVDAGGETVTIRVALHGLHLAPLVALAVAAARACGVPPAVAADGARSFVTPTNRLQPVAGPNGSTVLLDDTKSREAIALAALEALSAVPARRRIAVVGELMERPFDEASYATVAARAVAVADHVVACGRSGDPLAGLVPAHRFRAAADVTEVASILGELAGPGDAVLVHGSDAQHLGRALLILEGRDVGCRVRRCTLRWTCPECPHLGPGPPARVVDAA